MHDARAKAFRLSVHPGIAIRRLHVEHSVVAYRIGVSRSAHVGVAPELHQTAAHPLPDEEIIYRFQLSRILPAGTDVEPIIALNRKLYERAREMGGYRMTSSAVAMSQDDWKKHYGSAWPMVESAKAKFDPKKVLTPGYAMFPA
jgi:hypothetical protein